KKTQICLGSNDFRILFDKAGFYVNIVLITAEMPILSLPVHAQSHRSIGPYEMYAFNDHTQSRPGSRAGSSYKQAYGRRG
ncbi:MAG: hypothetical protein Q8869_00185, partial [Candidatus Phytoplasma australasiaticum]|nr:hypothetical protein [Candidatus Phytoplasma australasiaticum]